MALGIVATRFETTGRLRAALLASTTLALASMLAVGQTAQAQDATWNAVTADTNFNNGANWSSGSVPTGNAIFDSSATTALIVTGAPSLGTLTFNAGAPAYSFELNIGSITLNGLGIVNDSSNTPGFYLIGNNLTFTGSSTASNAYIRTSFGGLAQFAGTSTAGNAVIEAYAAGIVQFIGNSDGGNAQLVANLGGTIDFSASNGTTGNSQIAAGSIAGAGDFYLGLNQLTVGSNNLSTRVDGTINDGGIAAFTGASLVKIGTGTLTLAGINTYTGGTTVSAGVVEAAHATAGSIDALGTGAVTMNGGTLRATVTASLTNDLNFAASKTSTVSSSAGTTVTLTGAVSADTSSTITFGSTGDTGTVIFDGTTGVIDTTAKLVVAGGTLQAGPTASALSQLVGQASTTVNANATLNLADQNVLVRNLTGAGSIVTGSSSTTVLGLLPDGGTTQEFSGTISGAGQVQISSIVGPPTATVIFSGNNTYTGGTTVCDCITLQIGNGGTSGSVLGDITNAGIVAFKRSDTYTFDGAILEDTFIPGGQVKQIGTGKTILTGTSTYTGNTTIDAGTLAVNGDIRTSALTVVNSGGTLGGTGYVGNTQIRAGGTLAPGNSVGTLNVAGNLQFITGSTYAVEISSAGADRTNVSGSTILGGAKVTASVAAGSTVNKQYTILNSTGGFTGRFNSSVTASTNYTASLSYDTYNVYLNLSLAYGSGTTGLDQNQQNVGNALNNYFNANSGIPGVYGTLTANGLTQASGQPGANIPQAGFMAMGQFINSMIDNTGGHGAQGGAAGFADEEANAYAPKRKLSQAQKDAYAAVTPRDRRTDRFDNRWGVWASGYGGSSTVSGNATSGASATTSRVYGTVVGADYRASPDTRLGFALGGAGFNFALSDGLGSGRADLFQMGLYGRHTMGAAYLSASLAYGWQDVTTDRTVTVSGTDKLTANFKASTFAARTETGWRFAPWPGSGVGVTPYAALQLTSFHLPGYSETATSGSNQFALSYSAQTTTNLRSELGTHLDRPFLTRDGLFTLRGRLAWAHDSNTDRPATATFQTLPGSTFTVNGAQPAADAALISAGAKMDWLNGITLAGSFDGEFSSTTRSYAGKATLRYAW